MESQEDLVLEIIKSFRHQRNDMVETYVSPFIVVGANLLVTGAIRVYLPVPLRPLLGNAIAIG